MRSRAYSISFSVFEAPDEDSLGLISEPEVTAALFLESGIIALYCFIVTKVNVTKDDQ